MKDIIKAQLFQMKKSRFDYIVFVVVTVMQCTNLVGELFLSSTMDAGGYAAGNGFNVISIALMFGLVLTGNICAADFNDRTTNYEMMSGHLRRNIYFGRAVLALAFGAAGTLLLGFLPIAAAAAVRGWGNTLLFRDFFITFLLAVFPVFRIICEFIFLSFIVKNSYIVMTIAVFMALGGSCVALAEQGSLQFLGVGMLYKLFLFPSWHTYTLAGEKDIVVYHADLLAGDVVETVVSSVLAGGLFLLLGYLYFKKDDMN